MTRYLTASVKYRLLPLLAVGLPLVLLNACRGPDAGLEAAGPTRFDQLVQAYPELAGGRFATIADFEQPEQMELFEVLSDVEQVRVVRQANIGRTDTGRHALRFNPRTEKDLLLINNDRAREWFMPQDWRPFDLLMFSVFLPETNQQLLLEVTGGVGTNRVTLLTTLPMKQGWNQVRLDLAEMGERLPLDDIRELRLAVVDLTAPTEIILDDIILAGSREVLFGDPEQTDGKLYIQRTGRRWHIGAGGRFELTFANGQVVAWHDLVNDPYRLTNLVAGTTLGPEPVVMTTMSAGAPSVAMGLAGAGAVVEGSQQILEQSEVRVVLECVWRVRSATGDTFRGEQRWQYVIYPTGQIFVDVESDLGKQAANDDTLGLAVSLGNRIEFDVHTHSAGQLEVPEALRHVVYGTARAVETPGPVLAVMMADARRLPNMGHHTDELHRITTLLAQGTPTPDGHTRWQAQLFLGQADQVSGEEVRQRVLRFARPSELDMELGGVATDAVATLREDGYDPASGCYILMAQEGQVRVRLDASERPWFDPAFCVLDDGTREAWVYLNHIRWEPVVRDTAGNLIFQLPSLSLGEDALLEVFFRRPAASAAP
jgi:hypothetical protein